ncbi:hypothetical protein TUMSATVNIG1_59870 (plasmid) [Vibrio nigripulchritudo]|uniref:ParM/StbA family protein n=1 Tax=Vibrio nigripulchritudo TaxID=28173 RepID=UPI00190D61B8|nr:ParM/StbA family protein [Vibrio nigripulchritudo]BCL74001.1 hypothetical protein VNTUMSATTG_59380 [Vibrio nigripulchritudo]BDU35378.1 hypothetical protein TUMSATVNIG1_59870 [Vibrio nigripulchritudo]
MKTEQVAIDDGHRNTKGAQLGPTGPINMLMETNLVRGEPSSLGGDCNLTFTTKDEEGSEEYFTVLNEIKFGDREVLVDTHNESYLSSSANRVMVHAMLLEMGLAGKEVDLITTLPMQRYFKPNGEANSELINERNKSLSLPVSNEKGESVLVKSCTQVPEGFAAFINRGYKLKSANGKISIGKDESLFNKDILLFDFGGQTTDSAVISNGKLVSPKSMTGEGAGMLSLHECIINEFQTYRKNISPKEVDEIIKTGMFTPSKMNPENSIDVSEKVSKAVRTTFGPAIEKILQRTPISNFDLGFCTGGGASVAMQHNLIDVAFEMDKDPLFGNANGALKYLLLTKK